jgi:cytochrome c556
MNVRAVLSLLALAAAMTGGGARAGEPAKANDLMQRKLESAQKVLEGLATNDTALMARNADKLLQLSKEAEWRVFKNPRYELHSDEFRRAAGQLSARAREKNLDGAALAYVELTLSCVHCHKYVREVRQARHDARPAERLLGR